MDAIHTTKQINCPSSTTQSSESPYSTSYEYAVLDKTYFKYEQKRFMAVVDEIKRLRMPEQLCRFIPLTKKVEVINQYNELMNKLIKGFADIQHEAQEFRRNYDVVAKLRRDSSMDYSHFYRYICKEVNTVENCWNGLFEEGSLRSLNKIFDTIGLMKEKIDHQSSFNVKKWALNVQGLFSSLHLLQQKKTQSRGNQRKEQHYCCKWL